MMIFQLAKISYQHDSIFFDIQSTKIKKEFMNSGTNYKIFELQIEMLPK